MSSSAAASALAAKQGRSWRFYLSAWLPVALAVGCIALESQSFLGADHTVGPLRHLMQWLVGPYTDAEWYPIHHIIRKCGHFGGYGIVSLTWFRAFWMTYGTSGTQRSLAARKLTAHLLAVLGTFLVASADEFHQSFLPNRTGTPVDVLIDCSGAVVVQLVIFVVMLRFFRGKRQTLLSH